MIPERHRKKAAAASLAMLLAIPAEGLRQVAYYDPPGILTVCMGHTGDVVAGKRYSLAECDALLTQDMKDAVEIADYCMPDVPDEVLAAFSDAVFNMGPTIACNPQRSTAARMLKSGDIAGACNQLSRWNKARIAGVLVELPGLTKRRGAERAMCMQGVARG